MKIEVEKSTVKLKLELTHVEARCLMKITKILGGTLLISELAKEAGASVTNDEAEVINEMMEDFYRELKHYDE